MGRFLRYFELRILILGLIISFVLVFSLYLRTNSALTNDYNKYLLNTVSVASLQFPVDELLEIQRTEDTQSSVYLKTVKTLENIRFRNSDISSIYILRKSEDPNILKFIADADYIDRDRNGDGIISENEEAILPGDEYDVTQAPVMLDGFDVPSYETEAYEDLWGNTRSAYAPIIDKNGNSIAILGADVTEKTYRKNISVTKTFSLSIFFLFIFLISYLSYLFKKEKRLLEKNILTQEENKRLEELNELKNNFISIASHELRTPMTVIKSYTSMLQKEADKKKEKQQQSFLKKISKNTSRIIELVNDMLDISKLEAGKVEFNYPELEISRYIESIKKEFSILFKDKKIKLYVSNPQNIKAKVIVDKKRLHRIFSNLLSNAMKFTKKGGEVKISLKYPLISNSHIEVCVKDNGIGIPKEKQSTIFEKFSQVETPLQREYTGTGLGLAIVKNIIETMGGKIWCKSKENKGTSFCFTLRTKK